MNVSDRKYLTNYYAKQFSKIYGIIEYVGFCRLVVRKGKLVGRNFGTTLCNICVLLIMDACAAYLLWFANDQEQYLSLVEYLAIVFFTIYANLLLINVTVSDKYIGLNLIQNFVEIDNLLGAKDTKFMRDISMKFYFISLYMVFGAQIFIVSYMFYVFDVSMGIHVVGSFYFFWLISTYNDYCFFVYLFSILSTRARYLNVALIKISNMKMEYVPQQWLFHTLFWKDEYDGLVKFHTKSGTKEFCKAFKMLFLQLKLVEKCYTFAFFLGICVISVGSMVTVQSFIMYIQTADTMVIRATAIFVWSVASWIHLLIVTMIMDLFYRQIQQTRLICAYVQLKPTTSAVILKLTKDIFNLVIVRDAHMSIYDMFHADPGLVLRLAASTFVYITIQLQLAFPKLEGAHKDVNITITPSEFDFDPLKVKEFWFF